MPLFGLRPTWWKGFSSQELTTLETTAEQSNLDLAAAAVARVEQARGNTGPGRLRSVSGCGPERQRTAASAQGSRQQRHYVGAVEFHGNTFGASLSASYELDFWGLAQDNLPRRPGTRRAQPSTQSGSSR